MEVLCPEAASRCPEAHLLADLPIGSVGTNGFESPEKSVAGMHLGNHLGLVRLSGLSGSGSTPLRLLRLRPLFGLVASEEVRSGRLGDCCDEIGDFDHHDVVRLRGLLPD